MARRMVTHWGMSDKLGPVSYKMTDEDPFLGREIHQNRQFSEHTMVTIDEEVHKILQKAAADALQLLTDKKAHLQTVTDGLMEREELDRNEIQDLIGESVHAEEQRQKQAARDAAASENDNADKESESVENDPVAQ